MKQLFINKVNFIKKIVVSFLVNIFRLYLKIKCNFFMRVTIGTGNFPYGRWIRNFCAVEGSVIETRTWTLYFALPTFSEYMQYYTMLLEQFDLQTGKGPGYCYMIGRGPNCCVLGHVTELLFCLFLKIFLPSIFDLIDF